jgi:pullulanase/glycogen debranching enzyme
MLLGGDELGRTQGGNNNAYCQDNPTSWYDWSAVDHDLLAFTRRLLALRHAHPVLRRRNFATAQDLGWYTPAGTPMTDADWQRPGARTVAVHLTGRPHPTWTNAGGRCSTTTCSSSPMPGGSRSPSASPTSAALRTGRSSWIPTTRSGPQRSPPAIR